jgi:MFS family permease
VTTTAAQLHAARRRTVWTLFAGVGLGSTGNIAAATVATIVARDIAGTTAFSGAPGASVVLGSAIGSALLSWLMVRRGRRFGLTAGYAIGVAGAVVAVIAVVTRSLPLLLLGTLAIGFGNSSNQLSRYAAADMFPIARRASAIAAVVWGATIGAIIGPNLVSLAGPAATAIGLPALAGPYLVPALFVGAAALLSFTFLRPDPYQLADDQARTENEAGPKWAIGGASTALDVLIRRPTVLAAIVALLIGQIVMTLIMTMTPLHMTEHGHGLDAVGFVISAHVLGMYALSPISGRLTDRFGSPAVMLSGLGVLAFSGLLAALAPPDGGALLLLALFLLGFGWSLGFVAGSALLASGVDLADRTRLEGITDSLVWSSAAAASLSSGVVVAAAGYTALGLLAAALVIAPAALLVARRRAIAAG